MCPSLHAMLFCALESRSSSREKFLGVFKWVFFPFVYKTNTAEDLGEHKGMSAPKTQTEFFSSISQVLPIYFSPYLIGLFI